jgi:hypothetical protein
MHLEILQAFALVFGVFLQGSDEVPSFRAPPQLAIASHPVSQSTEPPLRKLDIIETLRLNIRNKVDEFTFKMHVEKAEWIVNDRFGKVKWIPGIGKHLEGFIKDRVTDGLQYFADARATCPVNSFAYKYTENVITEFSKLWSSDRLNELNRKFLSNQS